MCLGGGQVCGDSCVGGGATDKLCVCSTQLCVSSGCGVLGRSDVWMEVHEVWVCILPGGGGLRHLHGRGARCGWCWGSDGIERREGGRETVADLEVRDQSSEAAAAAALCSGVCSKKAPPPLAGCKDPPLRVEEASAAQRQPCRRHTLKAAPACKLVTSVCMSCALVGRSSHVGVFAPYSTAVAVFLCTAAVLCDAAGHRAQV